MQQDESVHHRKNKYSVDRKIQMLLSVQNEVRDKTINKPGELPVKLFEARNSLLTDLYEIKQIRVIYHIFVATYVGLFISTAVNDLLYEGQAKLGFNLILKGFTKIHLFILIWLCMFLGHLLIYGGFKVWATRRTQLLPNSKEMRLWDVTCLSSFIMYYLTHMYYSTQAVISNNMSIAISIAILLEMIRFLMKAHAFVRSNTPRVLNYNPSSRNPILCPTFKQFLYFSFAPVLLYQDNYPRSKDVRWTYVGECFVKVLLSIHYMSLIHERYFLALFDNYGIEKHSQQNLTMKLLENAIGSVLLALNVNFLILHVWMNMFAEMLRFSDRMFYKDWWMSESYGQYYRTWNVLVHDWLYMYIYKDIYETVLPKNKFVAKLMVFVISAAFHEYVLAFAFRFFFPIMFLQYIGIGVPFTFLDIKHKFIGNVFFLYTLALGMSFITSGWTMEYYARVNCPVKDDTLFSYFRPRIFSCNM